MRLSAMPTAYEESSILNAAKRKILALQVPSYGLYYYKLTKYSASLLALQGTADLLQPF